MSILKVVRNSFYSLVSFIAVFFVACFAHGENDPPAPRHRGGIPQNTQVIPYRAVLSGVGDFDIRALVKKNADIFSLQSKPPLTIADLKKRADRKSVV